MKNYQNPTLTLLALTVEDVLSSSGEFTLTHYASEGESSEIFGGFTPYQ